MHLGLIPSLRYATFPKFYARESNLFGSFRVHRTFYATSVSGFKYLKETKDTKNTVKNFDRNQPKSPKAESYGRLLKLNLRVKGKS